ncbi:MFS transporter [Streptomyces sp. LX-29]|uniref:MFS transporter n=1 Tax=Streptomyces sp. LX-29 TaxID=2900152 RepID=UPI00240D69DC|nr:MFS transporter [Streptomyces sp. LX-29]WFB05691.1 MFS transporter [Streptomyces sp. LX-29]
MSLLTRTKAATTTPSPAASPPPVLWLALLATPIALSANSPVLILPDMAAALNVRTATVTWIVTAFAWAMAVGTPLMANVLRRRGLRTALHTSAAAVVAGTVLVAFSPWLPLVMGGRAAQAVGGAGLVTVAMSLAGSARRMGVITAGFGVMGAVGPLLGSLIAETVSWRLSLSVSMLGLLAVPAVLRGANTTTPTTRTPFDARGALLLVLTATALVFLPRYPLAALPAALLGAVLLGLHVRAVPHGFAPLAVLRSPVFAISALLAMALSTSYFTLLFTIPQLLRDRTDWSTPAIGTGQMAALLVGSLLSWLLAAASARMNRPRVITILLTVGALAPLTTLLTPWARLLLLAASLAVFATTAGNGVLASYATQATPAPDRPTTIGLFNLAYQLGGAFGPALAALLTLGT